MLINCILHVTFSLSFFLSFFFPYFVYSAMSMLLQHIYPCCTHCHYVVFGLVWRKPSFFSFLFPPVFLGKVPQGDSIASYGDHSLVLKSSNGIIRGNTVEGVEGETFTALCIADSSLLKQAPNSMKWLPVREHMKDRQILQKREGNYTVKFTIAKLNRSDAGIYKCVMVMADNEAKEKQLELYVKPEG